MSRFELIIDNINFKKAAKFYILISILLLLISGTILGYSVRDKLKTALDYNKISESFRHNGNNKSLQEYLLKLASDSKDIINCIVVDKNNNIIYKTNDSLVKGSSCFILTTEESNKRYLHDNINKDVIYRLTSEDNILFTIDYFKNHQQVVSDIDENLYFEKDLQNQNVHLLNYIVNRETMEKLFIIRDVSGIPYAEAIINAIGIMAGVIFIIYWIGAALWVYKDANRKKINPALWGGIVLITNFVGIIVYSMYKQTNKVCYSCGALQSKESIFCGNCGEQINESCKQCGSIVGRQQHYCNSCGHNIDRKEE